MSIDAISSTASADVSAIDPLTPDLSDERRRREAWLEAANQEEIAQQEATVVTISDEVMAERRIADALAARDTRDAARKLAVSIAGGRDAANRAADTASSVVQEAVDALREASRENLDLNGEAIREDQDRAADSSAANHEAVAAEASEQESLQVGTTNTGSQVSYGTPASTLTGDAPLPQPGLSVFA